MTSTKIFYNEISKLKDLFHKYGRFDDSNAKLDEISKYISIYIFQLQNPLKFKHHNLKELITSFENDRSLKLVPILKDLMTEISFSKNFLNPDKTSIFGNHPVLNIDDDDNEFAYLLIRLIVNSIESMKDNDNKTYNFDMLNESFGHFVRDNFRNHIEDAQYMTPVEVVDLMCNIALHDLKSENHVNHTENFTICDPCCGVGSFLSAFYKKNREYNIIDSSKLRIIGQDKVSRMVRLAKINMLLFNNFNHLISNGNSLVGSSSLDKYKGQVDLILTNPPFGAKFKSEELKIDAKNHFPLLHDLIFKNNSNFDSEILFIDRCISLLKPNGKLLAILPDSVISSSGLNSILRFRLLNTKSLNIKGLIELPAVTFAQAGTRTKTSILYLEKLVKEKSKKYIFVAQSENIGFEVSSKKGTTLKIEKGENDLLKIFDFYKNNNFSFNGSEEKVLNEYPSCVLIKSELINKKSWTPSHFNARKFQLIKKLKKNNSEVELLKLKDAVEFLTNARKKEYIENGSKCISVLHILNDDNLNYEEMMSYNPKFAGTVCKTGDLLFSKINPRILRVLVVPDLGCHLTCSSEFEIMDSKIEINNYGIKLLLMSPSVQTQINYLTSGTSSSHNRIKSHDLANVLIPFPKKSTKLYEEFLEKTKAYEKRNKKINELKLEISSLKSKVFEIIS
ncbi:MAG: N-6 DNA methylase [Bacteroidota bacterium]|nr:N-6 DNA methylase [Bacteroidota bacterium]